MRYSRQRERIRQLVQSTETHPTAEWVYDRLKGEIPGLSLGTVYRNLKLLSEQGEIARADLGDGIDRFDCRTENHYHFVCLSCGTIHDLHVPVSAELEQAAAAETSFRITGHTARFYGYCSRCS